MNPILNSNVFLVKEHVGLFKASNNYDIHDPATGKVLMECRENIGFFTKIFRFTDYKRMTPFNIIVTTPEGKQVVRVSRGISIFLSKVDVFDENDQRVGGFKQKFLSIGGAFNVLDKTDNVVCTLKGNWVGWDFKFMAGNDEFAQVTKEWGGIGKELFTSADNYVLKISDKVPAGSPIRELILAAVLCIDMVLKE
ncbi:MAG: phospholipid scramblase-related protein [Cytophagaceae bacterium]